jgi:hypothetical protein
MKSSLHIQASRKNVANLVNIALLMWMILGVYLEIPLPLGRAYIPAILLVLTAPFLAVRFVRKIGKTDFVFVGCFFLLTVLSIALSPGWDFIGDKLKSSVQIMFSCCLMVLMVKLCEGTGSKALYWCFCISAVTIAVGLLLEFFIPGLKQLFNNIREVIYAAENTGYSYNLYDNLTRDISMVGRDRASFLTTEPSVAAEGIYILSNCCLIIRRNPFTIVLFAFVNFAALFTTGSPIVVASLLGGLLTMICFDLWRKPVLLVLGCVLLGMGFAIPQVRDIFSRQIERFEGGVDELGEQSIYCRIGFPYFQALPTVLERAPLFGVGVGGKKLLVQWSDDSRADLNDEFSVGTNALVRIFLFYGAFGGALFFVTVYIYLKRIHVTQLALLAGIWGFYANTTGALESPRFWAYTALLIAAFRCASSLVFTGSVRKEIKAEPLRYEPVSQK